ncbi:MAG: GAF domain-containing protein [Armatimonadetes bacterium]|nr:GAF domain-containing protein [Armatimonadota bacterium]
MSESGGKSVAQLIGSGLSYLKDQLRESQRAMVLARDPSGNMVVRAVHNVKPEQVGRSGTMSTVVAEEVKNRSKSALVLDASRDARFKDLDEEARKEFRSAICVPMIDGAHKLVGLLYADSAAKAGAFSHADVSQAEKFGREVGRQLGPALREEALRPPPAPKAAGKKSGGLPLQFVVPVGLVVLGLLWAFIGMLFGGGNDVPPPPTSTATSSPAATGPLNVAEDFLRHVRLKNYAQAHRLLSQRLQGEMGLEDFQRKISGYMNIQSNRYELQARRPLEGRLGDTVALIYVEIRPEGASPTATPSEEDRWTWTFVRDKGAWKVDRFNGGPFRE